MDNKNTGFVSVTNIYHNEMKIQYLKDLWKKFVVTNTLKFDLTHAYSALLLFSRYPSFQWRYVIRLENLRHCHIIIRSREMKVYSLSSTQQQKVPSIAGKVCLFFCIVTASLISSFVNN